MQKLVRVLIAAAVIALGIWGWSILFPNPEKVIRSRLKEMAETASFEPKEGTIPRALKAQKLTGFFTPDVELVLDGQGYGARTFGGRDELQQVMAAEMQRLRGLKVELLDIVVTLAPDKQTAVANLTAKVTPSGERDFAVQEPGGNRAHPLVAICPGAIAAARPA
jgi:hypothetical protein